MTARLRRRLVPALLAGVAVLAAGCTVGPSQRPPVAVRGDGLPGPAPPTAPTTSRGPAQLPDPDPQRPTVYFADCTSESLAGATVPIPPDRTLQVGCTDLTVPSDPHGAQAARSRIAVLRVGLADAPDDRPPLLVLGDTAAQASAMHAVDLAAQVPRALLDHFTLVGMDRRGFGDDALDCAPANDRAALVDADAITAGDPAALSVLLEQARDLVQECHVVLSSGASGFRTASTASDIGQLREALGVRRLSAVGVGDGATALLWWAQAAPETVGRLVLDGLADPELDEPARSEGRAKAAEATFDAFAMACTARPGCPLAPDPRAAVMNLLDQLRGHPLDSADGRRLTTGGAVTTVLHQLGEPRTWPALAAAVAAARTGDPLPMLDLLDPLAGLGGRYDAVLATTCNDASRRLSPGEVGDLAASWRDRYPLFGTSLALRLLACAPWPAAAVPAPTVAGTMPPVLVLGTANDPRAPLEGSQRAARALPTARFLSWQGSGTGAYPRTPCVNENVDRLLVDGLAPPGDPGRSLLCPP